MGKKPKGKSPAFQLYAKEWLACPHVMRMLPEQEGAYIHLLCFDWEEDGLLDDIGVLVHLSRISQGKLEFVLEKFKPHPRKTGWLTHPRLEKERKKQKAYRRKKSQSGKAGANKRWKQSEDQQDTKGKNDSAANGTATQLPLANDSSSSSSSIASASASSSLNKNNTLVCQKLIDLFKEHSPSMPKPIGKTQPSRRRSLLCRFKDIDEDETAWIELCKRIEASDFLSGRTDKPFSCGIDWVLKQANFNKILEGNYDNKKPGKPGHFEKYDPDRSF